VKLDERVAYAIALMKRHRSEPLSVDEIARAVNLSPSYLRRLFQDAMGRSPAQFDRERRLDQARELLMRSFLTVKQVMAEVGWSDPSHFSREFKRRFGVSPTSMRIKLRRYPRAG
jgi:AraC family transcriptional regulator, carnitine catabolism transcriptional activator